MISKKAIEDIYQLSPMQKGMLFHNLVGQTSSYICQSSYTIKGDLNLNALNRSINELVAWHPILRTSFVSEVGDEPLQVVLKDRKIVIDFNDIRGLENLEKEVQINEIKLKYKVEGFNLSKDILIKFSVLHVDEKEFILTWTFHHILMDGWCVSLLVKDFYNLYYSFVSEKPLSLTPSMPYKNYIQWLKNRDKESSIRFWESYLKGYNQKVLFPSSLKKNDEKNSIDDLVDNECNFEFDQVQKLKELSTTLKVTVNSILQAIWGIIINKYNDANDIVFGSVMSGRPSDLLGIDSAVGLFINTVPIRVKYSDNTSFDQLVQLVWDDSKKINNFQYESLVDLQKLTTLNQELVNSLYVFENYPDADNFSSDLINSEIDEKDVLEVKKHKMHEENNYSLTLICVLDDTLTLRLEYDKLKHSKEIIHAMLSHFKNMVNQILEKPHVNISELKLVSETEQNNILSHCIGEIKKASPHQRTIHHVFEEVAEKYPDAPALVFKNSNTTYAQLNAEANKLARYLRAQYAINPDDRVGLLMERSNHMIVAILAILKAGGAYVPIEVGTPVKMKDKIINDADVKLIIADSHFAFDLIDFYHGPLFALDIQVDEYESQLDDNLESINQDKDLAYIIYTSGSTGIPKGVAIEHKSVVNLVRDTQYGNIIPSDHILQLSNYAFDGSVFDIFGCLLNGATLFLIEYQSIVSTELLFDYIRDHKINKSFITTSLFNLLVEMNPQLISYFDNIYIGGEQLSPKHIRKALKYRKNADSLVNSYGPTEGNTFACYYSIEDVHEENMYIPIGKPLSGRSVYVLNRDLQINPYFVVGEIYLGGEGLARAYWNQETMTEEKFILNPFNHEERLYKTGDLGKLMPNGDFICLGRIDNQIKLRGFRIELGEIEFYLNQHPNINVAIVLVEKDDVYGDKLVAYYKSEITLEDDEIKLRLAVHLPDYMIPGTYIQISELPLTINGKFDRKSLLKFTKQKGKEVTVPTNNTEEVVLRLWIEVLGKESIGIDNDFFNEGGDSLRAIKLAVRINKEFKTSFNISFVFESPTIKKMAVAILNFDSPSTETTDLLPIPDADYYEVSYSQRRLWLLHQINKTQQAYNITSNYKVKGDFDCNIFNQAWKLLVDRHESLRTVIVSIDGMPYQKIQPVGENHDVVFIDMSTEKGHNQIDLDSILAYQSNHIFDLTSGPLVRCLLINIDNDTLVLSLIFHHIVTDGWSMNIMIDELIQLYLGILNKEENILPPLAIQYRDYANWQNNLLKGDYLNSLKEYWLNKLSGTLPVLSIIPDKRRPKIKSFNGDVIRFEFSEEILSGLKKIGNETKSSLFMSLTAIINLLLHKYSGQEDIIVGSPVAGRHHEKLENQIGFFINTLVLRTTFDKFQDFYKLLSDVRSTIIEAFDHQSYPFDQLVSDLRLERETSRSPLFDVMLVLQSQNKLQEIQPDIKTKFEVESYPVKSQSSHFDLTFEFVESENNISGSIVYNTDIFSRIRIERMIGHLEKITTHVLNNPSTILNDVPYLTADEYTEVVKTFNDTQQDFPVNKSLVSLFEEQVLKSNTEVAVLYGEKRVSFGDLEERSSKLAFKLRNNYGVNKGDLVGLLLDRSDYMIVSILGVLKAGAVYVPIDPGFPLSRIEFIIRDAAINLLLTDSFNSDAKVTDICNKVIVVDEENLGDERSLVDIDVKPDDTAYVIYTSGSTGNPKGVIVSHKSVVNRIDWMWKSLNFSEEDIIFQKTPYIFDVSVWELFLPLCYGAKMVICGKEVIYNPDQLLHHIDLYNVTTIHFVPTMFNFFISAVNDSNKHKLKTLKRLITSGEALSNTTVDAFKEKFDIPLYNLYGPTEATVDVTSFITEKGLASIPIGKPINNCQIYILDGVMQPVAKNVSGEICIGGVGVAKGYLNRPELMTSKFVNDPYNYGCKLYKTGDIGYWDEHGNIEFQGRIDDQVKIKGFRVELGEIENVLKNCKNVEEAIVIATDNADGIKELEAFILSDVNLTRDEIISELYENLSEHLIPSRIYQIANIPYTATGKVDKVELGKLRSKEVRNNVAKHVEQFSAKEEVLLDAIQKTLHLQDLSLDSNFFHLGGDSIKAIIITNRLLTKEYKLLISDIFKFPILSVMASKMLFQPFKDESETIVGEVPLTPIQREIVKRNTVDEHHYNQAITLRLKENFNKEAIIPIFEKIVAHHDALRIVIVKNKENQIVQFNKEVGQPIDFSEIDLIGSSNFYEDLQQQCEIIQQSIVLDEGPLMKLAFIKSDYGNLLFMVTHHLITDGFSLRIILEDLELLHSQYLSGETFVLPAKTTSFKGWAEALLEYGNSKDFLLKEKDFWKKSIARKVKPIALDFDFAENYLGDRSVKQIHLDKLETSFLLNKMNIVLDLQINDILVYSLCAALKDTFGNSEIAVMMDGHGREEFLENVNINRTVGWFTSVYPVIVELSENDMIKEDLEKVKESLIQVPNKGIGFGILKFLTDDVHKKDITSNLNLQVSFNYLGQMDKELKSDIYEIENLPTGDKMSPRLQSEYNLDISGAIINQQLFMAIAYSRKQYKDSTIEIIANNYISRLKTVIETIQEEEENFIKYKS